MTSAPNSAKFPREGSRNQLAEFNDANTFKRFGPAIHTGLRSTSACARSGIDILQLTANGNAASDARQRCRDLSEFRRCNGRWLRLRW